MQPRGFQSIFAVSIISECQLMLALLCLLLRYGLAMMMKDASCYPMDDRALDNVSIFGPNGISGGNFL
jgi:hypothetical protein